MDGDDRSERTPEQPAASSTRQSQDHHARRQYHLRRRHDDAETIPSCLTRTLSEQLGEEVDCLNFGVSSYTTVQEVAYFKHQNAMRFDPELVIVGFCVNDYAKGIGSLGVVAGQVQLLRPRLAAKLKLGEARVRRSKPVNPRTWKMDPPRQQEIDAVCGARWIGCDAS